MQAVEEIKSVTFGGYQLLERLAMGGMAEVFLARPEGQERFVAIKRILPNIAADDDFIAMFIDEAKIAGQLTHPNIAQILDIGKINSSYFIAMEYVSGHDVRALWDRVREQADTEHSQMRGLPIAVACHIVKKLAEGLDHAHRKRDSKGRPLGIIHRDVSPQNILISYDGDLKIIDFGIAKAANRIVKTQTGILKGKFAYMAPEQARGEPIDHRSDIFAIGVVLYELLTGERAFKGDTDFVLLEKVRRVDVMPARELRPDLPRELERIMMKALGREAADRYAWASALAGDLDRFMSDQGLTTSRDELGAFLRRTFRAEHAEEHRRLGLYRRRNDATERIDSAASVVRGNVAAKNGRGRRLSAEGPAMESTEVGLLAEQPTAMAMGEKAQRLEADNALDTKKALRRKREVSQEARAREAEARARAEADEAEAEADSEANRPSSSKAPSTAVGPSVRSVDVPLSTGSHRRRREQVDASNTGAPPRESFEPPPLDPSFDADRDAGAGQGQRRSRGDNVVVVAACLLGALLGAGLATGVAMANRAQPPDTLIVVTPRQSEVRLKNAVICAQTPCAVHLGPGRHDLVLQAPGAEAVSRTVEVGAGAAVLDVTLDRIARAVKVESDPPGATVSLDDVVLPGTTPLTLPPLAVGKSVRLVLNHEGNDTLTAYRTVEGDDAWRFDLPTPVTSWTVSVVPADAVVESGRLAGLGTLTLMAGKKPVQVRVQRPGCEPQQFALTGTGKAKGDRPIVLECRPMDSKLAVVSPKRPASVRVDGVVLPRGAPLGGYLMPAGTWNVVVITSRGKREATTIELVAGETREFRTR